MRLSVNNFRRVESAEIDMTSIALLAGRNEAGKTSTLQAAIACLTKSPTPIAGVLKKDINLLLRDGQDDGTARIDVDTGPDREWVAVKWPIGEVFSSDQSSPHASEIAVGTISLADMKPKDAKDFLPRYVNAVPTSEDVDQAMREIGYDDTMIERMQKALKDKGWDGAHLAIAENLGAIKRDWEQATGERYGVKKAKDWMPEAWCGEVDKTPGGDLASRVRVAKEKLDDARSRAAVSAAATDRQKDLASQVDELVSEVEDAEQSIKDLEAELEEAQSTRDALPHAAGRSDYDCPACGVALSLKPASGSGRASLVEFETMDDKRLKEVRLGIASADGTISGIKGRISTERQELLRTKLRLGEAVEARLAVDAAGRDASDDPAVTASDLSLAQDELAKAERALADNVAYEKATAAAAKIARVSSLSDLFSPTGMRAKQLSKALVGFNEEIAALSAAAGWTAVTVQDDASVRYGDRPYLLISESAQFRVRAVLQVAMSIMDGSSAVLIDRADMLDAKGRNGLIKMLRHAGMPALVCMTVNKPELVPDLARAGIGHSYWIEDGRARDLAQPVVREQAA